MELYTIGFTQKSAERFFGLLKDTKVEVLVDIRLNAQGQLAGFARKSDLPYFLKSLASCDYLHLPELAPTDQILGEYRKDHDWDRYARRFEALMDERDVPAVIDRGMFETRRCCLLCSESTPEQCHRRLVAERLAWSWDGVAINHIV